MYVTVGPTFGVRTYGSPIANGAKTVMKSPLLYQVIHTGTTCYDYQEKLRAEADWLKDEENRIIQARNEKSSATEVNVRVLQSICLIVSNKPIYLFAIVNATETHQRSQVHALPILPICMRKN